MTRVFQLTMDTPKDIGSTRVNSKSSLSSSCQDLSVQSSPASSQILSNESRLSDIIQASKSNFHNLHLGFYGPNMPNFNSLHG